MCGYRSGEKSAWRIDLALFHAIMMILLTLPVSVSQADAQTPEWYRLRTNSVTYQPQSLALDSAGGLWVSARDGIEYAPGVWYRPAGASANPSFQYITNDKRNNLLEAAYNPPVEKAQLNATVLYSVRDKAGNTWYALKNRKVLCEKADKSWLTFNMPDSSSIQPGVDTTNVDSAFRIRLIDKPDGTQEKLLIAMRGVLRVNAAFSVLETRQVYYSYNNYFIRDALIDSQGRYWVTSEMGLEMGTSLNNTTYVKDLFPSATYPFAPASDTILTRIVEDSQGGIWFGSDFGYGVDGIYCFNSAGQWSRYAEGLVNTISKSVHDIAAGSNGTVWFGCVYYSSDNKATGGILKYVPTGGGQWTQYTQADLGLESGSIPSLASDGAGLWFATAYNPAITGNGTGVHYLSFNGQGQPNVTHYSYRANSTALTNLRFDYIAADLSGGVWFPSYDDPSIARLKADGSWQQFRQTGSGNFGSFGFAGVATDSHNRIYFAPLGAAPLAYDVAAEQWLDLPAASFGGIYYYGVYVDPQDGKWFHGAYGVYYLNPANSAWTSFSPAEIPDFPGNYYINYVLMDDAGNTWFMCRYEIVLMKKNPAGGNPAWFRFTNGSAGYSGGYLVYQDDSGQIWNASKQKFDSQNNVWSAAPADTSALDHRQLRFLNGRVYTDMNVSGAPSPVNTLAALDEHTMTVDSRGTIFFTGGLGSVNAGIVAYGPLTRDKVSVTAQAGGAGSGSVSSSPAGISYSYNAASSATAAFNYGSSLVLTATAASGSIASWSDCAAKGGVAGGTSSAATCTFSTLISSKTVNAVFGKARYDMAVTVSGSGAGTVSSSSTTVGVPADISCSTGTCSASYPNGSVVSLTAVPGSTSTFDGWSVTCSANPCSVTMNGDKAITATFSRAPLAWNKTTNVPYYTSLAAALAAAQSGALIWTLDTQLDGAVTLGTSITLKGGWNATYQSKSGVASTLNGNMTVQDGNSKVDTFIVKGKLALTGGSLRVDGVRIR